MPTKPHLLILTPLPDALLHRLAARAHLHTHLDLTPDALRPLLPDAHALIVAPTTPLPDDLLDLAVQLQTIAILGPAHPTLRPADALRHGVELIPTHDPTAGLAAEHVFRNLLALNQPLSGATLGIIGFGSIGAEVARRALAFDMHVIANQPRPTLQLALAENVEQADLLDLLPRADFLTVHVSDRPDTRPLLTAQHLAALKPGAHLLNFSHPTALDLAALPPLLTSQRIASLALLPHPAQPLPADLATLPTIRTLDLTTAPDNGEFHLAANLVERLLPTLRHIQPGNQLQLHVAPLERVHPHEQFDPERVTALAARIANHEFLTNPPLCIQSDGHYIVLDGATRTTAFKQLGFPHVIVQVVDLHHPDLSLSSWHHALTGISTPQLLNALYRLPGLTLEKSTAAVAQSAFADGHAPFILAAPPDDWYLPRLDPAADLLDLLNAVVAAYTRLENCTIVRTLATTPAEVHLPQFAALVCFAPFTIPQVVAAGISGRLLPAGVTRFLVPGRVLRLNAELRHLRSDEPIARKQAWLDKYVAAKFHHRQIRYYQEPVYLLDE